MRKCYGLAIAAIAILSPTWMSAGEKEDKEAAAQVATYLRDSGKMQDYSIGVKYSNGTVWLAGRVTSEQQMTNALQVASECPGVEQIVNNLTVGPGEAKNKQGVRRTAAGKPVPLGQPAGNASGARLTSASQPARAKVYQGVPTGYSQLAQASEPAASGGTPGRPLPAYVPGTGGGAAPVAYDQPHMPNVAWPSYAAYPNYAAVTYPRQYSASAWPFIGPFHPYPQVPLGWRKVSLEWDDGWWFLDFDDRGAQ